MKKLAPYQLFFPVGFLSAIFAVGVWFLQNLGWFSTPALLIHSKLIMGGFLWSFITGFLMTAVPKMTGARDASKFELGAAATLLGLLIFSSWIIDARYFYALQILLAIFIAVYAVRRILKMTKSLPVFFSHVALGLLMTVAGSYFHFVGQSNLGIHLYHVGAVLLLVLGIGARFYSFLSGLPSVFEAQGSSSRRMLFHSLGVLTCVFLFFAGIGYHLFYLLIALTVLIYMFAIWQVQRRSTRNSPLKYAANIVAATIPLSFFLLWLQPQKFVTWIHVLFIGCFSLITFSVATRVTLAHGSYSTDLELKSRALWISIAFLVLGLVCRILYGFSDGMWKTSYLHLAATLWIGAILTWSWSFLNKIFKPGPQAKPSC